MPLLRKKDRGIGVDRVLGLDIDGVITASPDFFASLSSYWSGKGGYVHIVSSRSDHPEARQSTIAELRAIGIAYDHLYLLPSIGTAQRDCHIPGLDWYQKYLWQKVDYCICHDISLFYDDDIKVVRLFQLLAPEIEIIHYSEAVNDEGSGKLS